MPKIQPSKHPMFSNRGFGFVLFCFEENCIYQNDTNWRPELYFEKSLLQLTGLCTWLISTPIDSSSFQSLRSCRGPEAGLHSYCFQVGELGRPLRAGAFLCTLCAHVGCLPGSPKGLATWPPLLVGLQEADAYLLEARTVMSTGPLAFFESQS